LNGKSRVSREAQARFREGLGVQLPGATRPSTEILLLIFLNFSQVFKHVSEKLLLDRIHIQMS